MVSLTSLTCGSTGVVNDVMWILFAGSSGFIRMPRGESTDRDV